MDCFASRLAMTAENSADTQSYSCSDARKLADTPPPHHRHCEPSHREGEAIHLTPTPCIWIGAALCAENVAAKGSVAIDPFARRTAPAPPLATTVGEHWDRRRCHVRPNSREIANRTDKAGYRDQVICGVDVSSKSLDICLRPGGQTGRFVRSAEGGEALAAFCIEHGVDLVVMEAP